MVERQWGDVWEGKGGERWTHRGCTIEHKFRLDGRDGNSQSTTIAQTYFHMAQCLARWVVIRISEMMFRYTLGTGRGKSSLNLVIVSDTVGTTLPRYELYFW